MSTNRPDVWLWQWRDALGNAVFLGALDGGGDGFLRLAAEYLLLDRGLGEPGGDSPGGSTPGLDSPPRRHPVSSRAVRAGAR